MDNIPNIVLNDIINIDKSYTPEYIKLYCSFSENQLKYSIYFPFNNTVFKFERNLPVFDQNILKRILNIIKSYYIPIISNNISREALLRRIVLPNFEINEIEQGDYKNYEIIINSINYSFYVYNAFTYKLTNNYLEIFIRKRNYEIKGDRVGKMWIFWMWKWSKRKILRHYLAMR